MEPENTAALAAVAREIMEIQESVMGLYKAKQSMSVTEADYVAAITEYKARMEDLEQRQAELQTSANRYAEVETWLKTFEEHIKNDSILSVDDSTLIKVMVEQIIVGEDSMEIQFKCGVSIEQRYVK